MAAWFKRRGVDDAFHAEQFIYDGTSDTYTCPAGKVLRRNGRMKRTGRTNYMYRSRRSDCRLCPPKQQCCPGRITCARCAPRGRSRTHLFLREDED
jgi:hypothetical protein